MSQSERVLVVPTRVFREIGHFQGFCREVDRYVASLFSREHVSFRPRHEVEHDPSFKQLIPYVLFQHRDAAGRLSVFQYTRGTGQGEGRLHSKRSVGVGGHISSDDVPADGGNPYEEGLRRELAEEVVVDTPHTMRCVGLINDDQTPVGQVHLGVVHVVEVERPAVTAREADIVNAGFCPVETILSDLAGFETWSAICMEAIYRQAASL